jgi:hypothetical protein
MNIMILKKSKGMQCKNNNLKHWYFKEIIKFNPEFYILKEYMFHDYVSIIEIHHFGMQVMFLIMAGYKIKQK